jgi:hypothetical protein
MVKSTEAQYASLEKEASEEYESQYSLVKRNSHKAQKQKNPKRFRSPPKLKDLEHIQKNCQPEAFWDAVGFHEAGERQVKNGHKRTMRCHCHKRTTNLDW